MKKPIVVKRKSRAWDRLHAEQNLPSNSFVDHAEPSGDFRGGNVLRPDSRVLFVEEEGITSAIQDGGVELDSADPSRGEPQSALCIVGDKAQTKSRFNIVFLGDGFMDLELPIYEARVELLIDSLKTLLPFKEHWQHLNIWRIDAASKESGISHCPWRYPPGQRLKDTRYGLQGNFEDSNGPTVGGYIGAPSYVQIFHDLKATGLEDGDVGAYLVLANVPIYGGHSEAAMRMTFMPAILDDNIFTNVAGHELGHAIAGLADEYTGNVLMEPGRSYPNLITEQELASPKWLDLAQPRELVETGTGGPRVFKAQHRYPAWADATGAPAIDPDYKDYLGVFWGCSFVEEQSPPDSDFDEYWQPRGKAFYRPMATCKMRHNRVPFCRVCERAIADKITAPSRRPVT